MGLLGGGLGLGRAAVSRGLRGSCQLGKRQLKGGKLAEKVRCAPGTPGDPPPTLAQTHRKDGAPTQPRKALRPAVSAQWLLWNPNHSDVLYMNYWEEASREASRAARSLPRPGLTSIPALTVTRSLPVLTLCSLDMNQLVRALEVDRWG